MLEGNVVENLNILKESVDQLNDSIVIQDKEKSILEKKKTPKGDKQKQEEEKIRRENEKKKKDLEREEEKRRKEEERKKKEEERKKKEEEKKHKQAEKDEEKKKRDEEKRLRDVEKEEDRRRKEEEKKRKEEEKRRDELEKSKISKKQAVILDFFIKKNKAEQELGELSPNFQTIACFKPLEVKKDMKIAAIERIKKPLLQSLTELNERDLLCFKDIEKSDSYFVPNTWPISEPDVEIVYSSMSMRYQAKSFLFTENVRPPYFGTWRKSSNIINGLNPLAEDNLLFDYDLDSDQEWEYESGEDISNSEGEIEEEVNDDADDNSFLVPHGYLSDGEDCSDIDAEVEVTEIKINKRSMSPKSRQSIIEIREKQFQAEVKQKVQYIEPNLFGPFFVDTRSSKDIEALIEPYRMICQCNEGYPINCNLQSDFDFSTTSKIKSVPIEAIPHLIRLLHHNSLNRAKICYEFRMFWEYHLTDKLPDVTLEDDLKGKDWDEFTIGKKRLIDKIKDIAERRDGKWLVKPEIIHEYQLCCIDDDPLKAFSENWKYVSEVLKEDILKKVSKKMRLVNNENVTVKPKRRKPNTENYITKDHNIRNLNPSVQLIDNAVEKMEELKTVKLNFDAECGGD